MENKIKNCFELFCKEVSCVCHTIVRLMVTSYFGNHNYSENCRLWDKLNDSAHNICADLNPYTDYRYVSVSELRKH